MDNQSDNQQLEKQAFEIYSRRLGERVIFLEQEIEDYLATSIIAQLLFFESEDSAKDIFLYINSPGGSVTAGMAIYDTMQQIKPDVATICTGLAAGIGTILLSGGAKGKRMALSYSRIILTPIISGVENKAIDIEIQNREIWRVKQQFDELLSQNTGQSAEQISRDTQQDFFLSEQEAKDYGLIDLVIDPKRSRVRWRIF
ncbi:MAG TPA: ATP-dependent Clp protease proteolytic subunit [Candidatus Obscuribacterales bacterium]